MDQTTPDAAAQFGSNDESAFDPVNAMMNKMLQDLGEDTNNEGHNPNEATASGTTHSSDGEAVGETVEAPSRTHHQSNDLPRIAREYFYEEAYNAETRKVASRPSPAAAAGSEQAKEPPKGATSIFHPVPAAEVRPVPAAAARLITTARPVTDAEATPLFVDYCAPEMKSLPDYMREENHAVVALALHNFETFYLLSTGSATMEMLIQSSAGIAGWASCIVDSNPGAMAHNEPTNKTSSTPSSQDYPVNKSSKHVVEDLNPHIMCSNQEDASNKKRRVVVDEKRASLKDDSDKQSSPLNSKLPDQRMGDKEEDLALQMALIAPVSADPPTRGYVDQEPSASSANDAQAPTHRKCDEEALQLRLALLESVGVDVGYEAKLALSHDQDNDIYNDDDYDYDTADEGEWSVSEEDGEEVINNPAKTDRTGEPSQGSGDEGKWDPVASEKGGNNTTRVLEPGETGLSPLAKDLRINDDSEDERIGETGLSPLTQGLRCSENESNGKASEGSFVVVQKQGDSDSTSSEWSVL